MPRSSKGSRFEREFCKKLSTWWSGGEADDLFWRTSQSGGRATTRGKKGKTTRGHVGDICATDEAGAPLLRFLCFELKRGYNRHTLHDLIDKPAFSAEQEIEKWIVQARVARTLSGARYWAVVAQRDRREPLLIVPAGLLNLLGVRSAATVTYRISGTKKARTIEVGLLQSLWDASPRPIRDMLAG